MPTPSDAARARATAALVLADVMAAHRFLDQALTERLSALALPTVAALVQELAYGTLRWYFPLHAIAHALLQKPLKPKDADLLALLLLGLYQLRHLRVAPHAAVTETVNATEVLAKPWAKGLLNACLRRALREPARVEAAATATPAARYSHPPWLIEQLRAAYPDRWQQIVAVNNERPPMVLRVNARLTRVDSYLEQLRAAGIDATALPPLPEAIRLTQPVPVTALPHFDDGWVSVQDAAAQWAALWLAPAPGSRVLDACVAPGGKAAHLLERHPHIELVGVDVDAARLARVRQNVERLRLSADLIAADAAALDDWWDGRPFDYVLIDAPCSATGVLRRHPDIKLRRQPQELAALTASQARLLRGVWPALKPGGKLLYVTCSVLPVENEQQIAAFVAAHRADRLPVGPAAAGEGWQIVPGENSMDGFYYAGLRKR